MRGDAWNSAKSRKATAQNESEKSAAPFVLYASAQDGVGKENHNVYHRMDCSGTSFGVHC
jgi:hypothetical protein